MPNALLPLYIQQHCHAKYQREYQREFEVTAFHIYIFYQYTKIKMALAYSSQIVCCNFGRDFAVNPTKYTCFKPVIRSFPLRTNVSVSQEPTVRRSGDYKPCIWDYNFLRSLKSDYAVISFSLYIYFTTLMYWFMLYVE